MKLKIISIKDRGISQKEHILLKVLEDTNLQYYVIIQTKYLTPTSIDSIPENTHWFVEKDVKKGDFIRLYSQKGENSNYKNKAETVTYAFHMSNTNTIWNKEEDCAVLFEVVSWETSEKDK